MHSFRYHELAQHCNLVAMGLPMDMGGENGSELHARLLHSHLHTEPKERKKEERKEGRKKAPSRCNFGWHSIGDSLCWISR